MNTALASNVVDGQLLNAESELASLDDAYSRFCQQSGVVTTQEGAQRTSFFGQIADKLNFSTNQPTQAVADAERAIGTSIETLHESFNAAVGGAPCDWETWWSLAKDCEKQMGTVTKYSNSYGSVGGYSQVIEDGVKDDVKEVADAVKQQLPSSTSVWFAVGALILILILVLAIKVT